MYKLVLLIAATWCLTGATALAGQNARVEVATLDGAPVYHWRTFKSGVSDDVNRALILREFRKKSYILPPNLVDEAVQRTISQDFGGDSERFTRKLRSEGASLEDYQRFTAEEITMQAMLYQVETDPAKQAIKLSSWLADLRTKAKIKSRSRS